MGGCFYVSPHLFGLRVPFLQNGARHRLRGKVTHSQFLRQAIERNLRHYQNVERAIFRRIYHQGMS